MTHTEPSPAPRARRVGSGLASPALPFASAVTGAPAESTMVPSCPARGRLLHEATPPVR
ncbi:hypothetical protein ABZZ79_15650 [Streptomyces sp. NPDC006458]|uniref:hypothetical protein n=1 Tax=Streptomyces sp. NPDC006458 TaxID=3154302 RepID=UPI0033A669DC